MMAAAPAAPLRLPVAEDILAAFDHEIARLHQACCQLEPGAAVNRLYGCPGDMHLCGALLLRQPFQVNEADGLILVQGHSDERTRIVRGVFGTKPAAGRFGADPPSFTRPRHRYPP